MPYGKFVNSSNASAQLQALEWDLPRLLSFLALRGSRSKTRRETGGAEANIQPALHLRLRMRLCVSKASCSCIELLAEEPGDSAGPSAALNCCIQSRKAHEGFSAGT